MTEAQEKAFNDWIRWRDHYEHAVSALAGPMFAKIDLVKDRAVVDRLVAGFPVAVVELAAKLADAAAKLERERGNRFLDPFFPPEGT